MKIVLASASPRRRELLSAVCKNFEIKTAETDEHLPSQIHPREGVEMLAVRKGKAVAVTLPPDTLIISSDTLVELGGIPLGKPSDADDAVKMLLGLSGKTHNVHTGVAVHYKGRVFSGVDTSSVTFRCFDEDEAREYVSTGEPMDKAGAYAIQGIGAKFVEKYVGEFDTIVGLGLKLTKKLIGQAKEYDEK
jgi:septum formation protein